MSFCDRARIKLQQSSSTRATRHGRRFSVRQESLAFGENLFPGSELSAFPTRRFILHLDVISYFFFFFGNDERVDVDPDPEPFLEEQMVEVSQLARAIHAAQRRRERTQVKL